MAELAASTPMHDTPDVGLLSRLIGVIFSPRDAYTAVAARPRWFGAMAVSCLLMIAVQATFLSTQVGKDAVLNQQLDVIRAFGQNVTPELIQQMESRMVYAPYTTAASLIVGIPLVCAIVAGLL